MSQNLTHRVEFRTRGDGQCRSRVAAAMIGNMLVYLAVLHPLLQDNPQRTGRNLHFMEYQVDTFFLLRHPDTAVITQRLGHQGQLALLVAVDRDTGRMDLNRDSSKSLRV